MKLDAYVVDTLMRDLVGHDKTASAYLVYLYLWRRTVDAGAAKTYQSHNDIAFATGLSKSAVQNAVKRLIKRRLVTQSKRSPTAKPAYAVKRPWTRRD